jgi:hypothetical protein
LDLQEEVEMIRTAASLICEHRLFDMTVSKDLEFRFGTLRCPVLVSSRGFVFQHHMVSELAAAEYLHEGMLRKGDTMVPPPRLALCAPTISSFVKSEKGILLVFRAVDIISQRCVQAAAAAVAAHRPVRAGV